MTKKDIVRTIAEQIELPQLRTKELVQKTFDALIDALVREGRIELRNFGVFQIKKREARMARNPRTGERVPVQAKSVVTFKPGKEMEAKVDSLADGRLGVRFRIKGEHSPPSSPEIRLTLRELLTQKIKRTLPLPKGVKVDLSLDTSVNLDQLLDDFDKYQTLRNSAAVQP